MKKDTKNSMKLVSVNVEYMQMFVMIKNAGTKINVDVNVKNWLTKEDGIKHLFGILLNVNVNVSVINCVILENI